MTLASMPMFPCPVWPVAQLLGNGICNMGWLRAVGRRNVAG
jgi:hypothetical protein